MLSFSSPCLSLNMQYFYKRYCEKARKDKQQIDEEFEEKVKQNKQVLDEVYTCMHKFLYMCRHFTAHICMAINAVEKNTWWGQGRCWHNEGMVIPSRTSPHKTNSKSWWNVAEIFTKGTLYVIISQLDHKILFVFGLNHKFLIIRYLQSYIYIICILCWYKSLEAYMYIHNIIFIYSKYSRLTCFCIQCMYCSSKPPHVVYRFISSCALVNSKYSRNCKGYV